MLEWSLHAKGDFEEFDAVIQEYFHMGHTEIVPLLDLQKQVFYLPMHAVRKKSSTGQNSKLYLTHRRAPHFGGLWEGAVKSMKKHLKHVVANANLPLNS